MESQPLKFALPVDSEHKATEFRLFSMAAPHMRSFHLSWISFFCCFVSTFAAPPLLPIIRDNLNLTATHRQCRNCLGHRRSLCPYRHGNSLRSFRSPYGLRLTNPPNCTSCLLDFYCLLSCFLPPCTLLHRLLSCNYCINPILDELHVLRPSSRHCKRHRRVELTIDNIIAEYFYDRFNLKLNTAGMIAASFGLANTLGGVFCVILGQVGSLTVSIVVMIVFSVFVQTACGLTFGVVPFDSRRSLGVVSGMTGGGGNVGAVLTQLIFFKGTKYTKERGITLMDEKEKGSLKFADNSRSERGITKLNSATNAT
ncbi:hypothetical protein Q3G72_011919 [Acer saccharum]|nr:hypothetical protein Q3G72_011919 [Acer saccharum]